MQLQSMDWDMFSQSDFSPLGLSSPSFGGKAAMYWTSIRDARWQFSMPYTLQDYEDRISFLAAIGLGSNWMLPKRLTLLHPGPFGSVEI